MNKKIRLTESDLHRIIKESVIRILNEAYDPHLFDGVDDVDLNSIRKQIIELIGTKNSRNNPYAPIQKLVLLFSDNGALRHQGRMTRMIINQMMKDDVISNSIWNITEEHKKLLSIVNGESRINGSKTQLVDSVSWCIDEIMKQIQRLMVALEKSNIMNYYSNTTFINGTPDKRILGLGEILFRANRNALMIHTELHKLKAVVERDSKNSML